MDCHLYLWTVTGGGKGRSEDEFRIQITGAENFAPVAGCRTLVGGWSAGYRVWVFWDTRLHASFSLKSPSFQVHREKLKEAASNGIAVETRSVQLGTEAIVVVGPERLLWYVEDGTTLHNSGDEAVEFASLLTANGAETLDGVAESQSAETRRQRYELVRSVRLYRDSRFRRRVLAAYDFSCSVCGIALNLIDAAHIVPVSDPRSTDSLRNGLALCRLHHGAYDFGLMTISPEYRLGLLSAAVAKLEQSGLSTGLSSFAEDLPVMLRLPASRADWPSADNLLIGARLRGADGIPG